MRSKKKRQRSAKRSRKPFFNQLKRKNKRVHTGISRILIKPHLKREDGEVITKITILLHRKFAANIPRAQKQ